MINNKIQIINTINIMFWFTYFIGNIINIIIFCFLFYLFLTVDNQNYLIESYNLDKTLIHF